MRRTTSIGITKDRARQAQALAAHQGTTVAGLVGNLIAAEADRSGSVWEIIRVEKPKECPYLLIDLLDEHPVPLIVAQAVILADAFESVAKYGGGHFIMDFNLDGIKVVRRGSVIEIDHLDYHRSVAVDVADEIGRKLRVAALALDPSLAASVS